MRKTFKLNRITTAALIATAGILPAQIAHAGVGFVDAKDASGVSFRLQTYFANSPSGPRRALVPEAGALSSTGVALRKFVDPLPMLGAANATALSNDPNTSKYIPVAQPSKWVKPDGTVSSDDYYEIAVVEYSEKFHSDLKKATTLRGYVQIDHQASNGRPALTGSKAVALTYPDGSAILINGTDANGKLTGFKVPALAVDTPHFLGPVLNATSMVPTRVKFLNLLPTGRAETTTNANGKPTVALDASNQPLRHGDLFLPVDKSLLGAGFGPDGLTEYTQNRANIHLHGGDTPWISNGSPHQWITPADEADANHARSLAAQFAADPTRDPALLPNFLRGASAANVPDMNDPGAGASTYYFPNAQSARMLWMHDQSVGQTRLNVYAGMVAGYLLTDSTEQTLVSNGTLPPASRTIPLILQDRTFVPEDIAVQDGRWNTAAWGAEGDSWFPHVYETVQDPGQLNNWNAVGRWYYGPQFFPIFPALYNLPTGEYGDVTHTPESYFDTPIVNGVAYPTTTVEPTTYRLRILNASNDRFMTFNLFEGKATATLADGSTVTSPVGATEIDMVAAKTPLVPCVNGETRPTLVNGLLCTPATWPTDSRVGGVPAPTGVGPTLYQVANEGGWLPKVAKLEPTPLFYIMDKGRITVMNPDTPALFLAPGERADVIVDFSQYAGKTLIAYNDSGAPEPGADPRNAYFTGVGDQSPNGGAENTLPGYGPDIRTMMQFVVKPATGAVTPIDEKALNDGISAAFLSTQERPIVAQPEYAGFDATWANLSPTQSYAKIYTGTLKEPTFKFVPGTASAGLNSVQVLTPGAGYITAPTVTITPAAGDTTGTGATAKATLSIDTVTVNNPGSGYNLAPTVDIVAAVGGGNGALATATITATTATVTLGGSGYTSAPTVNFSAPPAGGTKPVATATVLGGKVTAVTITTPGTGYTASPFVTFTGGGGTGARATVTGGIDAVTLIPTDKATPTSAGGGAYTDLSQIVFTLTGGNGSGAVLSATGRVFDVSLTGHGAGYTLPPTITLSAPAAGTQATAQADRAGGGSAQGSILVHAKAIQELFDSNFGRYNSTLGVELPFTGAFNQTTIPLGYLDTVTEEINSGETQIWKITHNGLFTHPVHFSQSNVQLINRVGWDGFIVPPQANEFGWKETFRINPLEDAIVAVRPKTPSLPGFGLPLSVRAMDPTQPLGSPFGFTQIDPNSNHPASVVNDIFNYGWEYTWTNGVLSRAENDFIRPVVFHANEAVPTAPKLNSATLNGAVAQLNYVDQSATEYKFSVRRAPVAIDGVTKTGPFTEVGTELANSASSTDSTLSANQLYAYKVAAVGASGEAESNEVLLDTGAAAPFAPTNAAATATSDTTVSLSWTDGSNNEAGFLIERSLDGGTTWTSVGTSTPIANSALSYTVPANQQTYTDSTPGLAADMVVSYRVSAVNAVGQSTPAMSQSVTMLGAPALATLTSTAVSGNAITVNWTLPAAVPANRTPTGFTIVRTGGAATATFTAAANATSFADTGLVENTAYTYTVNAVNGTVKGTASSTTATTPFMTPSAPVLKAVANSGTQVTLNWTASTPVQSYTITRTGGAAFTPVSVTAQTTSYVNTGLVNNTTYTYTVTAVNGNKSTASTPVSARTLTLTPPTIGTSTVSPASIVVNWTDKSTNETAFIVERSTNNGAWTTVFTKAPVTSTTGTGGANSFTDTAVTLGNTYAYRVSAQVVTAGVLTAQSVPSGTSTVVYFAPTAVTNLAVSRVQRIVLSPSNDRVDLKWTASTVPAGAPALAGYTIEWSTTPTFNAIANTATASATATSISLTNVARGNAASPTPPVYYFRVKPNNAAGTGPAVAVGPVNTI